MYASYVCIKDIVICVDCNLCRDSLITDIGNNLASRYK